MFRFFLILIFAMGMQNVHGNNNEPQQEVQVGDIYEIGKSETGTYQYISFPRANFIIKKGGVANYNHAKGKSVVVTSVEEKKDGTTLITIKRQDGGRFFGSHTFVSVSFNEAITSGELQAK
ncbi:hypothetical protein ACFQZJ_16980 [Maribacter chungangensis]|uniref:Dihydroorotase n=1 Tax=Maribacter chungangensis TaxID=1069117 RepID=A0ABW3B765_9FLAO